MIPVWQGSKMYNFDKDILETLKKSGWHENREVSIDKILDYYSKVKYICNEMQREFLKSFSNLEINFVYRTRGQSSS